VLEITDLPRHRLQRLISAKVIMPGPIYELCSRLLSQHKHDHRQHNEKAEDSEDAQVKAETEQLFEEADIRVLREIVKDKLPPKIVSQDAAEANQLAKAAIENLNSTRTEEPWAPTLAGMVHQVVRPLLDRLFEWTYQRDQGSSDLDPAMILDGKLRRCLSELFVALVRLSECCPDQHTARLQLSGFMEQCRISQIYFDLYLSSYRVKGPFQWQETKCIFLKYITNLSQVLYFAEKETETRKPLVQRHGNNRGSAVSSIDAPRRRYTFAFQVRAKTPSHSWTLMHLSPTQPLQCL